MVRLSGPLQMSNSMKKEKKNESIIYKPCNWEYNEASSFLIDWGQRRFSIAVVEHVQNWVLRSIFRD